MDRAASLRRNFRLLFAGRALMELKTLNAIIMVFYLARGVSDAEIFYLTIAWSLGNVLFEIPTGYMADKLGRKTTMLIGGILMMVNQAAMFFAHGFPAFAVLMVISAAAWTCFSGTEEALMYDSLKELGETKKTTEQNGKLQAARHALKPIFPLIGAIIASSLLDWQINIILAIDLIGAAIAMFCYLKLTEPKHAKDVLANETSIWRNSVQTVLNDPFLFRATCNRLLPLIASIVIWRAYQPVLVDHGVSIVALGIFFFFLQTGAFIFKWNAGKIEERFGTTGPLAWSALLCALMLGIFLFSQNAAVLSISALLALIFHAAREPLFADALNERIGSHARATTLSNLNFLKGIFDIPVMLICSLIATNSGMQATTVVPMLLCLIAVIFFPIRKKDLLSQTV